MKNEKVDIIISQVPQYIMFNCVKCDHDNEIDFDEFVKSFGEPWGENWRGKSLYCVECCYEMEIDEFELG